MSKLIEVSRVSVKDRMNEKIKLLMAASINIVMTPYRTDTPKLFASIIFHSFLKHLGKIRLSFYKHIHRISY